MKRIMLACLLVVGLGANAWANCDVELAFSPDFVAAGDEVTLFASIANLGDEDAIADLEITVTFMDYEVGPLMGQLPLAAGEELSQEILFVVPPLPFGGTLTITVTATCNGSTDTAIASLTVAAAEAEGFDALDDLGQQIMNQLSGATLPNDEASLGAVKAMYR